MPLGNAFLLADDQLTRCVVENSPVKIPFFQAWLWQSVSGNPFNYARSDISPADHVGDCSRVTPIEPILTEDTSMTSEEFITRYQICSVDLDTYQYPNQLDAALYALAKRRLLYAYATFIVDSVNPRSLVGLCDTTRRVTMSGGALTLDCLDDAYERVVAGTGRPTLIMSHSRSLRTYRSLCRAAGIPQERTSWQWPNSWGMGGDSVDAFNGTPWLANDFVNPGGLPDEERIFFMLMGDEGGPAPFRGVTGIVPAAQGRNLFNKRVVQGILDPNAAGPSIPDMDPGLDTWVSMPAGLALGSQGALSIIENYTTVSSCTSVG
jgi:hypothetical protein